MRRRVVCGLSETIATLPPQSAFTSVDLPTFGLPATATKPLFIARPRPGPTHPPPNLGWGSLPTTHYGERTAARRTRLCRFRANSSRVEVPRLGKQVARGIRDELAVAVRERDHVDAELVEPLPAAAARRGRDPDRREIA